MCSSDLGYIGDVCRMGVRGEPTALMQAVLDEIRLVQDAAIGTVRAGVSGGAIDAAAEDALRRYLLAHATSSDALYLLGYVLHREGKAAESGDVHKRGTTSNTGRG